MAGKRHFLAGLSLLLALLFGVLGAWQVQRLQWKTQLIADVEARAHAEPIPAPAPADTDRGALAYQAVRVEGVFAHDRQTLVQAVTALGPGYWVMTPLETDRGFTVLVNRGFVPGERASTRNWSRPEGPQIVRGLVRDTELNGGFLRANNPAGDRWRSRDVAAIARAKGVAGPVATYFVDAVDDGQGGWPRGGLTVLSFSNNHLVYALTWFALAGLCVFGAWRFWREPLQGERA